MITKLTKKQQNLIPAYRNEWLDRMYSCKYRTDRKQATKYINWLYEFCGYKKPIIIFLDSPMAMHIGANAIVHALKNIFTNKDYSQIRSQINFQIDSQINFQIGSQIDSQIHSQIGSQIDTKFYSGYEGTTWHWGYYAWTDYYQQSKLLPKKLFKEFNNLIALCKANIYDMIQLDGLCVVSDMPTKITVDSQHRLHNEKDMAIEWADGYGGYFYNGTRVTEKIVKTPEKLTKKDWESEKNLEVRRVIQDRMPNFVKKLGAKTIQKDTCGELLEISLPSDPEKIARYVHVQDASTDRKYYLRVPPTIQTCKEGVAWTFGVDNGAYKPVIET